MTTRFAFEGRNFRVRIVSRKVRSATQEFEVVERRAVALCIPFSADGRVVLLRQYRAAVDGMSLEFPAGGIRHGEDPESAMRRELIEETGFVVSSITLLGSFLTAPHFSNEHVTVFAATGQIAALPTPTPEEDVSEVMEILPAGVKQLINDGDLADSKSLAAYMLACAHGPLFGVAL